MSLRLIVAARVAALAMLLSCCLALQAPSRPVIAQAERVTWTAIDRAGPSARWDHTLSADPEAGQLILFGGRNDAGTPFGDTWVYLVEEGNWTPVEGPAPSPRFGHAIAVDPEGRALYLFGGQADSETFFNDTWRFDLDALSWEEVATNDSRPSPRYGTSAVFDRAGHILVSHGFTFEGRFDDTWSLDLATGTWSDVSPAPETRPLKRCLHEAVWDDGQNRMLLYGGCSSGFGPCPQGDLWAFDTATQTWIDLTPVASPVARSNPALVRDEADGRMWLIDGLTEAGYIADLWTLDLTGGAPEWIETAQGSVVPDSRASHDATVIDGDIYLFGGYGNAGSLADFWVLGKEGAAS